MQVHRNRPGFTLIWLVEFIQNFPLVSAFIFGYAHHAAGNAGMKLGSVLVGVVAGALLIRYTEPRIEPAPIEKPAETLMNIVFFSLAILGFITYFSWNFGSWVIDLALSLAAGGAVSALQARAAGAPPALRHLAAMTLSFATAALLIRFWALAAAPLTAALGLTAAATTVIVLVEYVD